MKQNKLIQLNQNRKNGKLYIRNCALYSNAVEARNKSKENLSTDSELKLQQQPLVDNASHNSDKPHAHSKLSLSEQRKIRIIQRNYVFVHGLSNEVCNVNTLKSESWFGQFGNIEDIIVYDTDISILENRRYAMIVYKNNFSAKYAIDWINNNFISDNNRILKAMHGYERYCGNWLQRRCNTPNCRSVHNWCQDFDILTEEMHEQFKKKKSGLLFSQKSISNNQKQHEDDISGRIVRVEEQNDECVDVSGQQYGYNKQLNPMAAPFPNYGMQQNSNDMILLMQNVNAQQLILQQQQTIMQLNQQLLNAQNQVQILSQNYNALEGKYEEMELKYCNLDDKCAELEKMKNDDGNFYGHMHTKEGYGMWNWKEVYDWIVSVDNGRFKKYEEVLYTKIKTENIMGNCLCKLDIRDVDRIGITEFKDKIYLMIKINKLIENGGVENSDEGVL